jgi:uncharacterized protein YecT (DUF1311 family)
MRLLAAACVALLIGMPVHAHKVEPFVYRFVTTPEEGPSDPAVRKRHTAQFWACQERAVSTQAHGACFAAESARQDQVLNRTWRRALASVAPKLRGRLVAAQRKWIAKRDPFCRPEADKFREGTIAPLIYIDCRIEQTIRRTMWLEQLH